MRSHLPRQAGGTQLGAPPFGGGGAVQPRSGLGLPRVAPPHRSVRRRGRRWRSVGSRRGRLRRPGSSRAALFFSSLPALEFLAQTAARPSTRARGLGGAGPQGKRLGRLGFQKSHWGWFRMSARLRGSGARAKDLEKRFSSFPSSPNPPPLY